MRRPTGPGATDGDHVGHVRRARERASASSATSPASTSSSSAAGPATSPPGSRGGARGRSASTSLRRSSTPRAVSRRDGHRVSADRGERRGRAASRRELRPRLLRVRREHLVRSVPLDSGGVPAAAPRRTPRVPGNSPLVILCRRRGAGITSRRCRPAARDERIAWSDGASSSTSATATCSACSATGLRGRELVELFAPDDAETHEYYSFVTADWARKWPVEEIWAARKPA